MQILGSQTSPDMMNPFEFPRQQEDAEMRELEISRFQASQRLFAPNQSSSSSQQQRVQTHQNNLQDPRNALTLGSNNDEVRRPPSATVSSDRSELRNGERGRFSVPSATIRQHLSASYHHSNIPNVHRSVPTILGHQQLGRDRIQQLQRLPSISSLHMLSTPVNLERNGNLQNLQHQLAIQKDIPQQIQQQQPPGASSTSTPLVVQVQQQMTQQQDSESKFLRIMDIAEEIIAEPGYDPEQFAVQLQERCVNANLHGRHFYNSWVKYTTNIQKRWENNGFKFATAADQRFAVIKRKFDNSYCVSQTAASNSASTPQHTAQASSNETMSRPRRGTQPENNGLSSNSNVRKDSRAVLENVTGQLTHSESSSNNNRTAPKMAQHHQKRDKKFQAIMAVAEEIVGEADFEPKDFGTQLNQRCKNTGVQGASFATSWYHYVEYAQKRWKENGNEFANVNDERFADIHRRLDASYCMPGQSSPHDTEDRSSNSNINEGNASNDRSNRRQRRAATPGPSSKRIRQNVSDPQESPQTNPPPRQRLDFLLPPMNSRPVAPQFSNHERLQQIYIDRFNEQQREYDNRNSFPPRDGFHGDHSSSMPRSETTAENEEQNGSGKESSTKSDMISASVLENDEPQVQPDPPLPMPNNLTVDEHSFAKKAATKSKMASSNDDKTNPFQSEVEVDENVTVPSENQNSENLQPSDSVTVEPNVTTTAAEIAEIPSEITVGLSPFFSAPLSTSPSNISSSLASEARQQQSQQFAANLQVQSPAQMHEQTQQLQQIYHSGQSDLFTIISNQIRTMENQTNSMAKLMEKQLDAFKTNSK